MTAASISDEDQPAPSPPVTADVDNLPFASSSPSNQTPLNDISDAEFFESLSLDDMGGANKPRDVSGSDAEPGKYEDGLNDKGCLPEEDEQVISNGRRPRVPECSEPIDTYLNEDEDDHEDIDDISGLVGSGQYVEADTHGINDYSNPDLDEEQSINDDERNAEDLEQKVAARIGKGDAVGDDDDLVTSVAVDREGGNIAHLSGNASFFDDEEEGDDVDNVDSASADDADFEGDVEPASTAGSRSFRPSSGRAPLVGEPDENDDLDSILTPMEDDLGFEGPLGPDDEHGEEDDEASDVDEDVLLAADDQDDNADGDDFDAESEEDIQSAAEILSDRGLLGLGVEKSSRGDSSSIKKFALGEDDEDENEDFEEPNVVGEALGLPKMIEDESDVVEEDEVTDDEDNDDDMEDYPDMDDDDDDLGLTSQASFGKVWELNEDTYVTITEAGESFGYELDEEDQEDQDMATMRRGKQGGWSGGLASYPASDLPEGSREWIARRSYELMMKASTKDMYRWTKRHMDPPPEIAALYPDDPPATTPLGKTTLQMSTPPAAVSMIGKYDGPLEDFNFEAGELHELNVDDVGPKGGDDAEEHALNRSIKFPCLYKFKVEGDEDDGLIDSVRETTEGLLGKDIPLSAFTSELAGRYQRVTIVVEVQSARQVTELYDALRGHPLVKFSYG